MQNPLRTEKTEFNLDFDKRGSELCFCLATQPAPITKPDFVGGMKCVCFCVKIVLSRGEKKFQS